MALASVVLGQVFWGLVAMSHWARLLFTAAKVNLLVLVVSAVFSRSVLSDRVPEFALTKIEESDIQDDSGKEPITEDDADPEDLEVFYPTHQWQPIRPGQAVPAGSHVRLNLQTGDREAKLPDSENGKSDPREERRRKRLGKVDIDSNSFTSQELKKALAKMKESEKAERKAHEEEVRKKFRPIEQLKEEFEKLNVKMETDYEIMVKLISKFNSSASTLDEKVAALYDLEYYVHQQPQSPGGSHRGGCAAEAPGHFGHGTTPGRQEEGSLRAVLHAEALPLRPAAVPQAGRPPGPPEPLPAEGDGDPARPCGDAPLRPHRGEDAAGGLAAWRSTGRENPAVPASQAGPGSGGAGLVRGGVQPAGRAGARHAGEGPQDGQRADGLLQGALPGGPGTQQHARPPAQGVRGAGGGGAEGGRQGRLFPGAAGLCGQRPSGAGVKGLQAALRYGEFGATA
ncbi:nucleotide exchange factor SIL1 isoform 3-T7 [Chlamydotis macqueenii]